MRTWGALLSPRNGVASCRGELQQVVSKKSRRDSDSRGLSPNAIRTYERGNEMKHGVAVNDLYAASLPHLKEWQREKNVHFNPHGRQKLAELVAKAVASAL